MRYHFDDFVLDTDCFELSRAGKVLRSEPQVIALLALLVEHHERMVSKEEINQHIWNGRFVGESALSSRIKSLRQLLGDSGKTQRYVRTVHKKGFRFVAPVHLPKMVSAGEVAFKSSSAGALIPADKPRVVVLPFSNLTDTAQEYLSDGITSDIISHLSRHRWLQVTARNSSFGYKGKQIDVRQLGKELDVDYVVEGSVQRAGHRVRVVANLSRTADATQIWSDRFDGTMDDIFVLQDEITEKIAARVEPEIGLAERNRIAHSRPANMQAWDCYHLGIYHFFKFTAEDNLQAQHYLKQSQLLDENFGEAHAWWAYALILGMVYWDTSPTQALLDEALTACERAVQLDYQNASFHALKARVLLARCEYDKALAENEIAISFNQTFAAAHCGLGDSLAYEGRYDEALQSFERSIALSPNDPQLWAFYTYGALALIFKQDFEAALRWCDKALTIPNCQYWTTAHRVVALANLQRLDEAKAEAQKLLHINPDFSLSFAREKLFYLKMPQQIQLYLSGLQESGIV